MWGNNVFLFFKPDAKKPPDRRHCCAFLLSTTKHQPLEQYLSWNGSSTLCSLGSHKIPIKFVDLE